MLLSCGVGEDSWESPWTARRSNQSIFKEISPEYSLEGLTDAEAETPILWPPDMKIWLTRKDLDAGKDWRQEEKGMTGWDGWMASQTRWTWVWVSSRSWWWTGKPGMLHSMGSQRVRYDWVTELNWFTAIAIFQFSWERIFFSIRVLAQVDNTHLLKEKLIVTFYTIYMY